MCTLVPVLTRFSCQLIGVLFRCFSLLRMCRVGGGASLMGAIFLGPRLGRFTKVSGCTEWNCFLQQQGRTDDTDSCSAAPVAWPGQPDGKIPCSSSGAWAAPTAVPAVLAGWPRGSV